MLVDVCVQNDDPWDQNSEFCFCKDNDKCHFLISGNLHENLFVRVGSKLIWESAQQKLLGVIIDKNLTFNKYLSSLCKKVSQKVTALARISKFLPFHKRKLLFNTFIQSQFSYCPLVWMFCSRTMNNKIKSKDTTYMHSM